VLARAGRLDLPFGFERVEMKPNGVRGEPSLGGEVFYRRRRASEELEQYRSRLVWFF